MNAQEIVNRVWDWFGVQKQPLGWNSQSGMCDYRGDGGSRCAVGCLLEDDEVPRRNLPVRVLVERGILPKRLLPHTGLLDELQRWHDYWARLGGTTLDWPGFAGICQRFGLEVPK